MEKHNGIISFGKFIFSVMIIIHHFSIEVGVKYFKIGYLGVEFFFIISGCLMTMSALKVDKAEQEIGEITWKYIWKKVKVLFPYVLVAYIVSVIVKSTYTDYKNYQYAGSIWNLLLIDMSGITTTYMLAQEWYISAMLISMLIIYPLIIKYKKNFTHLIAPAIVIFVGGYISHTYGKLDNVWPWTGLVYKGLLRAFFEICLGAIVYEISEKIKKLEFTKFGEVVLTIIEIMLFVIIFISIALIQSNNYDFIILGLITIYITMVFSQKNIFYRFFNNKVLYYLEKLSLPLYLNHLWVKNAVIKFFTYLSIPKQLVCIIITFIFSIIELLFMKKLFNKNSHKIKKMFVIEGEKV